MDEKIINLKKLEKFRDGFKINKIVGNDHEDGEVLKDVEMVEDVGDEELSNLAAKSNTLVKVKFSRFVQLLNNCDIEKVVENNEEEEIILNSNLFTEMAFSKPELEKGNSKWIFIVGIVLGVFLAYLLFKR